MIGLLNLCFDYTLLEIVAQEAAFRFCSTRDVPMLMKLLCDLI